MMRKMRKAVLLLATASMTVSLISACSQKTQEQQPSATPAAQSASASAPAKLDPVTLNVMLWGDKPKQFDDVVAEFEKQTQNSLNVKLNVTWTPQADYVNKLKLKLSAGEQVDLAFDAPWMNLNQFVSQDIYAPLDSYFFNDKYSGLKSSFSETFIGNNRFIGTDGKSHIYGVPLGRFNKDLGIFFYRKDLAAKYGINSISSYQDLVNFLDKVHANNPDLVPFAMKNNGTYGALDIFNGEKAEEPQKAKLGLWDISLAPNFTATVYIKDNKLIATALTGEDITAKKDFPAPFNAADNSGYVTVRDFHDKGYIEKNPINTKDAKSLFTAGKAAAMSETITNLPAISSALKAAVPGAEVGMYLFNKAQRDMSPQSMVTDFRQWNFLSIPKTSKNIDRTMMFLNWLFSDQKNHDLFELGISGKHWVPVGDQKYKYPDGVDASQSYNFPGYELTWNPNYVRQSQEIPDDFLKYFKYLVDDKSYIKSGVAGFAFNGDKVKNNLANPDIGKMASDVIALKLGIYENPEQQLKNLENQWKSNKKLQEDIAAVKAELITQLQAFLVAGGNN